MKKGADKMDVLAKAQELAEALGQSSEYQRLKQARETIEQHESAKIMLRNFSEKQLELQKQQLDGQPITESQVEELRQLYEVLSINPYIRELFEAEFQFSGLMMEVQEVLTKAISLKPLDDDQVDQKESQQIIKPEKKIWTPGS